MLNIGDTVPTEIELIDTDGQRVTLAQYSNDYVILYFYPQDNTTGCSDQARSFQEKLNDPDSEINKLGAKIVGVSRDDGRSHEEFKETQALEFALWSDPEAKLMKAFGVWHNGEEKPEHENVVRSAFVIDPAGKVIDVIYDGDPKHGKVEPADYGQLVCDCLVEATAD